MALRDQPYLPLYIQDVMTDEKLIECSASAHGIYLRLMCILHKQDTYGVICLKQKYKQNESKHRNFALMLSKQMPFTQEIIYESLQELSSEGVVTIEDNRLFQKRMVKDGEISEMRKSVGKKGGSSVTKQYGKPGFLYLMSDGFDLNKIGISSNPKNRLYRLRCDLKLPKHFEIIEQISVPDMGTAEDEAFSFFADKMDGEWVKLPFEDAHKKFVLLKAKYKANIEANSEYEIENENINEFVFQDKGVKGEKELNQMEIQKTIEYIYYTIQVDLTEHKVKDFWKAFQIHSEKDSHVNRADKITHFRNWIKKQKHETAKRIDTARPGAKLSAI